MRIYLDDNLAALALAGLLQKAGHDVVRPIDAGLVGAGDARHLEHAVRHGLIAMSSDSGDFEDLDRLILTCGGRHPGILVVRYENDPKRDMKPKHIAAAVGKLERSGTALRSQVVVLNHWR